MKTARFIPLVLGLLLVTALVVHDLYDFFVTNEGVEYFASEPRRLLYVAFICLIATGVTIAIGRLSPLSQRKLKLAVLGSAGLIISTFFLWFIYAAIRISDDFQDSIPNSLFFGMIALALVITGLVWFEFFQVLKTNPSHERR